MQSSSAFSDTMVDYRRNLSLTKDGVSFHFCEEDSTSMHYHNFYEFFLITHGKTRHELNGQVAHLSRNTLYMIRPEDTHQFTKLPGFDCTHMNICVTCERLAKICGGLGVSVSELEAGKSMALMLSERDMDFFTERAHQIGIVRRSPSANASVIAYELVAETVSQLNKARLFSDIAYPEWFGELLEKIHSPDYLACTAADIYRLGGFSPPVMIGCFKEYTGKTVAGYLRDYKLERACEMLRSTRLTSLEISSLLGYDSLSHFNRIFKSPHGFFARKVPGREKFH